MKTKSIPGLVLVAGLILIPAAEGAELDFTNRLGLSMRFGLNISARFTGPAGAPSSGLPRTTPDGAAYNYDDGYVLTDVSGNAGDQTWNWGYDESARQIVGNTIEFRRSTVSSTGFTPSTGDDLQPGVELVYNRQLGRINDDKWAWGFEVAVSYLNLSLKGANESILTDAYPFTPGTTPPLATPANPYQGTFNGPGFAIGATPVSSTSTFRRQFDADMWGFRLGPYLEIPLCKAARLGLSAGVAAAVVEGELSWSETMSGVGVINSDRGREGGIVGGGYAAANIAWQFSERWSLIGGAQYQSLRTFHQSLGARGVAVDLGNSIFVTLGLGFDF